MTEITPKTLLKSLLPITSGRYPFITNYIGLYLLSPFLNVVANNLTEKRYKHLLIILFILTSVLPTFGLGAFSLTFTWFIFLYLCGGYIKKYPIKISKRKYLFLVISVALYLLIMLSVVLFNYLGLKYSFFSDHARHFIAGCSIPMFLFSLCLFIFFANINIGRNRCINIIAKTTLGIFLLHDGLPYEFLWDKVVNGPAYYYSQWLPLYAVIVIIAVFIACMLIDLVRIFTVEKLLFRVLDKSKIVKRIDAIFSEK